MSISKKSTISAMDVYISSSTMPNDDYLYSGESLSLDFSEDELDDYSISPLSVSDITSLTSTTLGQTTQITGISNSKINWGGGGSGALYTGPHTTITSNPTHGYSGTGTWDTFLNEPKLVKIQGDAEFSGKVKIGGKDIGELLLSIEERLAILHPNPELEERWETLKQLGKQYKELEADIKEKEQIWAALKK